MPQAPLGLTGVGKGVQESAGPETSRPAGRQGDRVLLRCLLGSTGVSALVGWSPWLAASEDDPLHGIVVRPDVVLGNRIECQIHAPAGHLSRGRANGQTTDRLVRGRFGAYRPFHTSRAQGAHAPPAETLQPFSASDAAAHISVPPLLPTHVTAWSAARHGRKKCRIASRKYFRPYSSLPPHTTPFRPILPSTTYSLQGRATARGEFPLH